MKKKTIALTGGIASGKSTVSDYLKKSGYEVIDADLISREITAKGSVGLAQIIAVFGEKYLTEEGTLNRKALGGWVFAHPHELAKLEKITLPLIEQEIERKIEQSKGEVVFVDGATIIENGLKDKFTALWLVGCDEEIQLKRLCARDNLSRTEALRRINSQLSLAEKKKYADVYLDNSGEKADIYKQVDKALLSLGE